MTTKMTRTFIFEDEFFSLTAIKSILQEIPEIQIIGFADTEMEAIRICHELKPNLIIADAKIGDDKNAGAKFVKYIRKPLPEVRILGMTYHPECVDGLKRAGCNYVFNKALLENSDAARKYILEALRPRPQYYLDFNPPTLSQNQDEVLKMICDGKTEVEIASQMGYETRKPVRKIKNELFDIFGAVNVPNLVHLAYLAGYLRPEID